MTFSGLETTKITMLPDITIHMPQRTSKMLLVRLTANKNAFLFQIFGCSSFGCFWKFQLLSSQVTVDCLILKFPNRFFPILEFNFTFEIRFLELLACFQSALLKHNATIIVTFCRSLFNSLKVTKTAPKNSKLYA